MSTNASPILTLYFILQLISQGLPNLDLVLSAINMLSTASPIFYIALRNINMSVDALATRLSVTYCNKCVLPKYVGCRLLLLLAFVFSEAVASCVLQCKPVARLVAERKTYKE